MKKRNILYLSMLGKRFHHSIGNGYIKEFVNNGVLFMDFERLYLKYGNAGTQQFLIKFIDEEKIDTLILFTKPDDFQFSLDFYKLLKEKVFLVLMLGDVDSYFYLRDIYYAQYADLVIVMDCFSRYRFQHYGINSISFYSSYDKTKYYKIEDAVKDIDVSFVGNIIEKFGRQEYVDLITKNNIPIEVFGYGSKHSAICLEDMVKVINRSKISLSFNQVSSRNMIKNELKINQLFRQIKGRLMEVALCGGFVLSQDSPGLGEVFALGKEIVTFSSQEELLDKIRFYLKNDKQREEIARNGYLRALKDYEVSAAIPRLLSQIELFKNKKVYSLVHEPYADGEFITNYTTYRFYLIGKFLKMFRLKYAFGEFLIILKYRKINFINAGRYFIATMFPVIKKVYLLIKNGFDY